MLVYWSIRWATDAGVLVSTMGHRCWCIGQYDGPLMLVYWSIRWATDAGVLVNTMGH